MAKRDPLVQKALDVATAPAKEDNSIMSQFLGAGEKTNMWRVHPDVTKMYEGVWKNMNAIDNIAAAYLTVVFCAPAAGVLASGEAGAVVWSFARQGAQAYGRNFLNGGAKSLVGDVVNQSFTQYTENGKITLGRYDYLSFGLNSCLNEDSDLELELLIGGSGGVINYVPGDGGFTSPLQTKSSRYVLTTVSTGMLSPLMNEVPIMSGGSGQVFSEILPGIMQGLIEKGEK